MPEWAKDQKSFKWWPGGQNKLGVYNNFKIPLLNSPNATLTWILKWEDVHITRLQKVGMKLRMSWKIKEQLIKVTEDITGCITSIPYYKVDYKESILSMFCRFSNNLLDLKFFQTGVCYTLFCFCFFVFFQFILC